MKHLAAAFSLVSFSLLVLASCVTPAVGPKSSASPIAASPLPTTTPTASPSPVSTPVPTEVPFDPKSVTAQEKKETLVDVNTFISDLNKLTQNMDYEGWKSQLTDNFIEKYSDPVLLAQYSQRLILKRQGIVLKSLKDYFKYVVYPSHQNDRVDDIEFLGHNRVQAITLSGKGERLVLWELEKSGNSWKIGIGR